MEDDKLKAVEFGTNDDWDIGGEDDDMFSEGGTFTGDDVVFDDDALELDSNVLDTTIIQVLVMPLQLEKKTIELFITQDNVFCKQYMTEQVGDLPEYAYSATETSPWMLPRVRPVRNGRLLTQLYQRSINSAQQGQIPTMLVQPMTITDIKQRCAGNEYEVNYINSQMTLCGVNASIEFGG